jgi:hypothetical protein
MVRLLLHHAKMGAAIFGITCSSRTQYVAAQQGRVIFGML